MSFCVHICTPINFNKDFNWDELFANNRFRKLYQRLADSKNRYNHFHEAFALHMGKIFDLSMKSNDLNIPNGSTLKELKFIAYRKQTLPWNDFVNEIQRPGKQTQLMARCNCKRRSAFQLINSLFYNFLMRKLRKVLVLHL